MTKIKDYAILAAMLFVYIVMVSLFLSNFNGGYQHYQSCLNGQTNATNNFVLPLGGAMTPNALLNGNLTEQQELYYECGWHWKFSPSDANLFEILFGADNGARK